MEKRAHLKRQRQASTPSDIDGELEDALASATTTTRRRRVSSTLTSTTRTATRSRLRTSSTQRRTRTRTASTNTLRSSESAQSAPSLLSDISSPTAASSSASHASSSSSSSSGLPSGAKAAVIAVSVGVGSVIILAILFFCLRKRRKPPRSQGPSPMMISLDSAFDEKSFGGGYKHADFAPAINHYDGRPLSFLDNIHSTLRSQDRHFENVTHPESQAGSHARQSQEDPFRFGYDQGAAFANDGGRHPTPAQHQFPPQHPPPPPQGPSREVEELLDAYQRPISSHPYALPSETSFSRNKSVKSVKFSDDRPAHPFALTNPDVPQSPPQHRY